MKEVKRKQGDPSPAQLRARERFREAARHAKALLLNAERKRYYSAKAREEGLPSAYVAAVAEYLRSTPLVKVVGKLNRKVHPLPVKYEAPVPVVQRSVKPRSSSRATKRAKRKAAAMFAPGIKAGIICSSNLKIKKMEMKKLANGFSFSASFY